MVKRRVSPVAVLCCCFAAALAMWCVPVSAHHGISAYSDHLETLKGTVSEPSVLEQSALPNLFRRRGR